MSREIPDALAVPGSESLRMTGQADSDGDGRSGLRAVAWFGPSVYSAAIIMMVVGIAMVGDPLAPETTVSKIGWFLIFGAVIAGAAGLLVSVLVACAALRSAVLGRCGWATVAWNAWPTISVALTAAGAEIYSLNQ
jgi:hypothetical protein